MNILIVDDEPRHLRGMAAMVQTMRPNARVLVAKDGEIALACIRSETPDVVLSDIQMPNMDGLALLKLVAEEGIRTKIVMVSAFNLFEFAQTAIRHGAYDYLLKPIDADKVEELLQRMESQLAAEKKERGESAELKQRLQLASTAYRSRLLHLWLSGDLSPEKREELADWAMLREVDAIMLTEINSRKSEADDLPALLQALTDQLEQAGSAFGQVCVFSLQSEPGQSIRIVTALRLRQPMAEMIGELRAAMSALTVLKHDGATLTHGIGVMSAAAEPDTRSGAHIPHLYRRAQTALAYTFHDEWRGIVNGSELSPLSEAVFRLDGEQLFEALQEPTMAAAETLCRTAFEMLAANGHADPKLMKDYAALTIMKIKSRTKDIVPPQLGSALTETAVSEIPVCSSSGALMELLLLRLSEVHRSLNVRKQGRNEQMLEKCLSWIQEHYQEDVTLEMAAERYHFNASYFSTLIKSRTGRSFSDHLMEARMRRAKELLGAGQLKIYEISEQCGYRDTKYFTRVFKRQVGVSPEAYKHMESKQSGSEGAP
ncbi:response regulator transcription factor [Paenibacillus albus]|uniref:Response regulator n=1 Tax=Paenibacillus albus TaxID=2495582 RepID=A0A3Q8X8I3_9BACL|nr:response regulator [Paenibacillus albus]AZN42799.1 response regulator [Paenibacillus albus]